MVDVYYLVVLLTTVSVHFGLSGGSIPSSRWRIRHFQEAQGKAKIHVVGKSRLAICTYVLDGYRNFFSNQEYHDVICALLTEFDLSTVRGFDSLFPVGDSTLPDARKSENICGWKAQLSHLHICSGRIPEFFF